MSAPVRTDYRVGQEIEVEYQHEWYRATVKALHPAGVDADWGDGTYASGLLFGEVRPMVRNRSPSPPLGQQTRRRADTIQSPVRTAQPHPQLLPLQYEVDPTYVSSLFKTLSLKCGVFPPSAIPERDLLWFFRSKGEEALAMQIFYQSAPALFPLAEGRAADVDPGCSPRRETYDCSVTLERFADFYGCCDEKIQDWIDEVVFGPEYLKKLEAARAKGPYSAMRHATNLRLIPKKEESHTFQPAITSPLPPPAGVAATPPPLLAGKALSVEQSTYVASDRGNSVDQFQDTATQESTTELPPPGGDGRIGFIDIDARVNLSGSPHRTRREADEARINEELGAARPPSPRDIIRQEVYERIHPSSGSAEIGTAMHTTTATTTAATTASTSPPPPSRHIGGGGGVGHHQGHTVAETEQLHRFPPAAETPGGCVGGRVRSSSNARTTLAQERVRQGGAKRGSPSPARRKQGAGGPGVGGGRSQSVTSAGRARGRAPVANHHHHHHHTQQQQQQQQQQGGGGGGGMSRTSSSYSRTLGLPGRVTVSGVVRKGFKCDLNGAYCRVARSPADEGDEVVQRYRREGGGAVLYKTPDGRWRLNDSVSPVGWVYSHHTLLGAWEADPEAGDYTGASGTPYPLVVGAAAVSDRPSSPYRRTASAGRGEKAVPVYPEGPFARPKPGIGLMSSGSPRMSQRFKASTDALYGSPSDFTKPEPVHPGAVPGRISPARVPQRTSSFGTTPRFHKGKV